VKARALVPALRSKIEIMKNTFFQKAVPHLIAILIFLVVSVFFCKPVLEGNVLNQFDVLGWKGVAQNAFDYKEKHGHFPLWNTNVFSGMPNYQIAVEGKSILPDLQKVFSLGLPQPINFFFLAAVCFYILCVSLGMRPVVAVFGALAYSFSTYNPVILSAGHMTKMAAIVYMPLLLAGLLLIYHKRYWIGLAVLTLGTYMELVSNHPQINYYLFLVIACVTIGYVVTWIMRKEWKHIGFAIGFTAVAAIAGVAANSFSFLIGSDYAKYTIRGGQTIEVEGDNVIAKQTKGLDTSYAFQYSFAKSEPLVMLMPKAFGGSSATPLNEDSHVIEKLTQRGLPENVAVNVANSLPAYWGGLESTSGPAYIGIIVGVLALLGFVLVKHPVRWGLLAATVLSILMSWGKFSPGFNTFLFENLPLYNKFRAPSMSLVMAQLTLPVMATLAVQQLFFAASSREFTQTNFRKILFALGGLVALVGLVYIFNDFSSPLDGYLGMRLKSMGGDDQLVNATIAGLKADRSAMFGGQVLRTIIFAALVLGIVWAYTRSMLKPFIAVIILTVITTVDLLVIGKKYFNEDNYQPKEEQEQQHFTKTPIDEQILTDKDVSYRVFNAGPDRFSASDFKVSVFHKAIGGYHAAKLRIYQDIIARYLSDRPNPQILNMLNTKYIIAQNPENGQQSLIPNPEAYGNCWFVKNIRFVKDDVEEIQTIGNTNLRDTAVVKESFREHAKLASFDSTATISISKFDNDTIQYVSNSATEQFAVFSEIYYPGGWNAYIDGKKVEHVKTDYALRGLSIPPGKHDIQFIFEPEMYKKAMRICYIASFFIVLLVGIGFFMSWRTRNNISPLP
jgi:hypothetical protein